MTIFDWLIGGGTALTLAGLAGLAWCILAAIRLRRQAPDDAALRAAMRPVVAVNMAALAASTLGLMLVIAGVGLAP